MPYGFKIILLPFHLPKRNVPSRFISQIKLAKIFKQSIHFICFTEIFLMNNPMRANLIQIHNISDLLSKIIIKAFKININGI